MKQNYIPRSTPQNSTNEVSMHGLKIPIHKNQLPFLDSAQVIYKVSKETLCCRDMCLIHLEVTSNNITHLMGACVRIGKRQSKGVSI